jgi:hypothetical protein
MWWNKMFSAERGLLPILFPPGSRFTSSGSYFLSPEGNFFDKRSSIRLTFGWLRASYQEACTACLHVFVIFLYNHTLFAERLLPETHAQFSIRPRIFSWSNGRIVHIDSSWIVALQRAMAFWWIQNKWYTCIRPQVWIYALIQYGPCHIFKRRSLYSTAL